MASLNNMCIFEGHLGDAPKLTFLPDGTPKANFSLATSYRRTDKETGEIKDKTTWVYLTAIGKLAEVMNEHLKKGSHISVMSHYQSGSYVNEKKEDVYTHSFICDEFRFLDKKSSSESEEQPKNEN